MKHLLFTLLLLLGATTLSAQKVNYYSAEEREAKYRSDMVKTLAIDYSMPDYTTKKVDASVMGTHMATMVNRLLSMSNSGISYQKPLNQILGEQEKKLKYLDFAIKKMKFLSATKKGNDITLLFNVWLDENSANIKQTQMTIHFIDGISESKPANDLFSSISYYARNKSAKSAKQQ